jgi:hypothetical protein
MPFLNITAESQKNLYKDTAHIFSYRADLDYVTLETKQTVARTTTVSG